MTTARWIAPLTMAAALALSVDASAGDLQVRDDAHVFASSDAAKLRAVASSAPFDARIVTTTAYPDQAGLSRYVGGLFSEPNMVVVGIDPEHHHVQVHFGTGSHVPRGAWSSVERAGNDSFRQGAWEQGSETILREAAGAVTTAPPASGMPSAGAAESHGSFFGPLLVVALIIGVVAVVVMMARRRGAPQGGPYGGSPFMGGGGPYPGAGPYAPGGPGPYYGPQGGPVQGGGLGPVGGGLIGAGLGGLAGYELGKMAGEREEREHDAPFGGAAQDTTNEGDSFDAGGGGSSWDDTGGGDVGGFDGGDSGGGGSEF